MNGSGRPRILITGASGFIGQRVCARLNEGAQLVAVTRREIAVPGCTSLRADLASPVSTDRWPERIDCLVHLAQSVRHREFPEGAADMTAINVTATAALIEYARRAGASSFVLASTGSVYTPRPQPAAEDDPIAPAGFYAATKAAAEDLVRPYRDLMRVCVLRLFHPYGPGQEGRLIPSLVDRVREGRPISLAGGDGLVLTPTYVDDIAGVIAAASEDRRFDGVFNVSAPEVLTLRAIGYAIGRVVGRVPHFERAAGAEPPRLVPDLDRLSRIHPVREFTTFEAGLSRMLRVQPIAT